jgi:plasmid maintenance system antidote protein VapI
MTMKPPHPGDTLKEEYFAPFGMSVNALAKELGIELA